VNPVGALPGMGSLPMSYLRTFGPAVDPATRLGWGLGIVSIAVVLIISALLLGGLFRPRSPADIRQSDPLHVGREGKGMRWIYIGVSLSTVVLMVLAIWTMQTIAAVSRPQGKTAFTIRVTGYEWWWRLRYEDSEPARTFTTANEIHIPVGVPVRLEIESGDVIHSFWAPQLGGKTDAIPGQTNVSWVQADRPGLYRGQCAEYCGAQHAHMALLVIADQPDAFNAWWDNQLRSAEGGSAAPSHVAGQTVFSEHCAACHAVRGIGAGGIVGPDLTHLMSRQTIASGTLHNDPASLAGWIRHAQDLKPGTKMPSVQLSDNDLNSLTSFLQTLR
jgi:cytochrome c oxidase subunit 2